MADAPLGREPVGPHMPSMITRQEKYIIVFLSICLIVGLGVNAWRKLHGGIRVEVRRFREGGAAGETRERINVNSASREELMKLKGVGKVTAGRILDYRASHGAFSSPDELAHVKGVGTKVVIDNRDRITVEDER